MALILEPQSTPPHALRQDFRDVIRRVLGTADF